jgi:hypothetical protein
VSLLGLRNLFQFRISDLASEPFCYRILNSPVSHWQSNLSLQVTTRYRTLCPIQQSPHFSLACYEGRYDIYNIGSIRLTRFVLGPTSELIGPCSPFTSALQKSLPAHWQDLVLLSMQKKEHHALAFASDSLPAVDGTVNTGQPDSLGSCIE